MQRSIVRNLTLATVVVLVVGVGIFSATFMARAKQNARVPIGGQTVPLIKSAHLLSAANEQQQLNLSIGLQLRNQQELDDLLRNIYNPRSSLYHHFLTPQQFTAEFGPTVEQQKQVADYLRSQGFTVTSISPNGLLIDAKADIGQVENTFAVKINNYQIGARKFYANANAPTVPATLSTLIMSIGGMDNSTHMRPLTHLKRNLAHAGYAPADLNGAYDANPLKQAGINGSGQTVAVFELDGYQQSDITQYLQTYNLGNPSISNVLVDGFNGSAGSGAIEVELDIEVVAAMAPGAAQIVYEGPNTTQGVNDTYNKIVTDNKTQITTISWGECETQSGASELQTLDAIFKQGAAQGMSMFAASGDSGAYDCNDSNLAVDSPASDPYIIGVGGTNLQASSGSYGSESVWSNPSDTQRSPKGAGGGGGLSNTFPQPSWQVGPGVKNQYSNGNREVPDVSADADPATGYNVYCTVLAAGCTGNIVVGGTSAAAPLWAGSMALINQYLQKQGKKLPGFAAPTFYALANSQQQYPPFHDVTSGNNLYYPATSGYDMGSGIGTPDIYNIARDIANGNVPTPTVTPGSPTPTPTGTVTATPTAIPTNTPTVGPTVTATTIPPTPIPSATVVPPPTGGSLLKNGDFESGTDYWNESSAAGYELIDAKKPHRGQYSAYLCGYSGCNDVLSQDFSVPSSSKFTLTYWVYVSTSHTGSSCQDSLKVLLLDSYGQTVGSVKRICNTAASSQWQQITLDVTSVLSQHKGETMTLIFVAQTTYTYRTTAFFVDDVALVAQ